MRVYISGPISGIEGGNTEAFRVAYLELVEAGHYPVSPIDIGWELKREKGHEPTWTEYMREDIKALMDCDGILMLDGWNRSKGSRVEKELAEELEIKQITLEREQNGNEKSL